MSRDQEEREDFRRGKGVIIRTGKRVPTVSEPLTPREFWQRAVDNPAMADVVEEYIKLFGPEKLEAILGGKIPERKP